MAMSKTVCKKCGGLGYILWLNRRFDIYSSNCKEKGCGEDRTEEHWPELDLRATSTKTRGELLGTLGSRLPCDAISGTVTSRND